MNVTMNEVVFIDQRRKMHAFDSFLVPARNIKYIHVPEEVNILEYIRTVMNQILNRFANCW